MSFTKNNSRYQKAFGTSFHHSGGSIIKLFPFNSDRSNLPKSLADLKNFRGIAGGICRDALLITQLKPVSRDQLIQEVIKKVNTDHVQKLHEIISRLLFDEKGSILLFSHQVLPYLTSNQSNAQMKTIEAFVSNLLLDDEIKNSLSAKIKQEEKTNILHQMVLDQLSELTEPTAKAEDLENYYSGKILVEIRKLFKDDLQGLIENPKLFSAGLAELIKFYYFIYIIRLAGNLGNFFERNTKIPKLYFSLEWERLSKTRLAVDNGWHVLKNMVIPLFAHSNCIEMINTITIDPRFGLNNCFIYQDLVPLVEMISSAEENELILTLTHFLYDYKKTFKDKIEWAEFTKQYVAPKWSAGGNQRIYELIHELFSAMKYQFENNSGPRTAYNSYSSWFNEFAQKNYYKSRGPLGGTLKIDKETLLLFTELAIASTGKDKILISELWTQLDKRDILLDLISKKEVIAFFDKINILEKKSDSGDAQFVKRLYKLGL